MSKGEVKMANSRLSPIELAQIKMSALSLAHDRDAPPQAVVERAKAYLKFVEDESA